jgi:hypothetical protein
MLIMRKSLQPVDQTAEFADFPQIREALGAIAAIASSNRRVGAKG